MRSDRNRERCRERRALAERNRERRKYEERDPLCLACGNPRSTHPVVVYGKLFGRMRCTGAFGQP